jgi:predicted nucleotidyltransferase component of viral defense system
MKLTASQLKAKARAYAIQHDISVHEVLQNYMLERILYRLSNSVYSDRIILKGGLLISSLFGLGNRTTMDLDTNIRNMNLDPQHLLKIVAEILDRDASDNLEFTVSGYEPIRKDDVYGGLRIKIIAQLEKLRINLSLDFSSGDIITPNPILYSYPQLFETSTLTIMTYNLESILAEKLHVILDKNGAKGRMKDYYDLHHFVQMFSHSISSSVLSEAIFNTFNQRNSLDLLE